MTGKNVCILALTIFLSAGCKMRKSGPGIVEAGIPVITAKAEKISIRKTISLSGNIEGDKTVRLGFMVAGKIDYIGVNEGEQVFRERLLSSLDPSGYSIAKEMADIQLNQIQDEYDRLKLLYDKKSLSESDFAKIGYGLQQSKAQQKLHNKNLADTKLYSPINGVLLKKMAEVGEIAGVGMPLFVISDIRKVKVNAFIPENELHNIKLGQRASVTVSSLNKVFEGEIIEVGFAADPASRAFSIKIEVQNPDLLIRPGMIAETSVITDPSTGMLVIPVEAIQHDYDDRSFVYVADTAVSKAYRRYVSPGRIADRKIEIISGLNENEIIITGGQQHLFDGSVISINK